VSGSALAVFLSVLAGLAGAVQVAMMSQLGDRISVVGALAFATLFTAVVAFVALLLFRQTLAPYRDAFHQPWWMLLGGIMGLLIVFTITYAGGRLGVAATVGILIAGQLVMGAAIDRWGLFGSPKIELHWYRILGIVLLAAGAALSLRK
jgi:bacterial/archaeal transporter family-2 protein